MTSSDFNAVFSIAPQGNITSSFDIVAMTVKRLQIDE
jgi:hypothetical protein